jgi:hypothetical protein
MNDVQDDSFVVRRIGGPLDGSTVEMPMALLRSGTLSEPHPVSIDHRWLYGLRQREDGWVMEYIGPDDRPTTAS